MLALRNKVKEEEHLELYGGFSEEIGMKTYLHGPMDTMSKRFLCNMQKERNEHPNVGGVSIRSRNCAPSRKRCVVNGQMTKASNK